MDSNVSRLSFLADDSSGSIGTHLEEFTYLGLDTVVQRRQPQAPQMLTYIQIEGDTNAITDGGDQYVGLDRFGRIIDQNWVQVDTEWLPTGTNDRFQYGYDRNGNRLYKENTVDTTKSELYHSGTGYDKFDRLTSFSRGTLDAEKDGLTGAASRSQNWTLDALGNWGTVTSDGTAQTRTHNKQNQLTGDGTHTYSYDANGNLKDINLINPSPYDAWNRLIGYEFKGGNQRYEYDALGRRIASPAEASAGVGFAEAGAMFSDEESVIDHYYTQRWQVIEDRNGDTGALLSQYVWSPHYVDEMVLRDRDADGNPATGDLGKTGSGLEERVYVQQDANYNVTALTDATGAVIERYVYDPYGFVTVLEADWDDVGLLQSTVGFNYFHQGGRYDAIARLYHFRNRDYSALLGRWVQQDPLGYMDGASLYQYVSSNPNNELDPSGLMPNKDNATTLFNFIEIIKSLEQDPLYKDYYNYNQAEMLVVAREFHKQTGAFARGTPGSQWKYLYTQDAGWIDLPHFLTNAEWTAAGVPGGLVEHFALGTERTQEGLGGLGFESQGASAWGVEDVISNRLGNRFGAGLKVGKCEPPLSKQLQDYFTSIGATDPKSAPNYYVLPQSEGQWTWEWKNKRWLYQLRILAYRSPQAYHGMSGTFNAPVGGTIAPSSS